MEMLSTVLISLKAVIDTGKPCKRINEFARVVEAGDELAVTVRER
jgi:hypothetical protein